MARYKVSVKGIDDIEKKLGRKSAGRMKGRYIDTMQEGVEDMAEDSFQMAPVETSALRNSIKASVTREAPLTWYYGSVMPYAQRQEYEHKSKRHYFYRSVTKNKGMIFERLVDITKNHLT